MTNMKVKIFCSWRWKDWKFIIMHLKWPDICYKGRLNHLIALFYIQSNAHFLTASAFEAITFLIMQRKPSNFLFFIFSNLHKNMKSNQNNILYEMSCISIFQFISESLCDKWDWSELIMKWNDKQYFHTILMDY